MNVIPAQAGIQIGGFDCFVDAELNCRYIEKHNLEFGLPIAAANEERIWDSVCYQLRVHS